MTSATVVTVNYRLGAVSPSPSSIEESIQNSTQTSHIASSSSSSSSHSQSQPTFYKYPTPIHDTLAAFDWIKTHLNPAQLGVIGSHIGGSIALMLALTEAQSVKAVASIMPVTDWVGLDDYCITEQLNANTSEKPTTKRGSRKKSLRATTPRDLVQLLAAREALFSSPERCFDAFASPILFLRSAGRDVPRAFPLYMTGPEYRVPVLKNVRHAALDGSSSHLNEESDSLDGEDDDLSEAGHTTIRRRKALSRWPPYGLDYGAGGHGWAGNGVRRLEVTLPWVKVYIEGKEGEGNETVLADQGEEMVSVMRRACFFGREKGFGERRVGLVRGVGELQGLGIGEEVGGWFEGIFDGRTSDE
jgi:pimeloyl-ACP methyl ester carboxylesterase